MVLDAALLDAQHYKVRIKGKVEQSRKRSNLCVVAIEKGAFGSLSTKVTNFTYFTLTQIFKMSLTHGKTYPQNCVKFNSIEFFVSFIVSHMKSFSQLLLNDFLLTLGRYIEACVCKRYKTDKKI